MPTDHMDTFRGYDLYRNRKTVRADQRDVLIDRYEAANPKNNQTVAIADDLDDLRAKVAALPQAYVTVGEYLFELTHDRGEPRDIVVNVFNVSDGKLAGKGIGRLPWAADAAAVKKALAGRFDDATPDEIAELVNICRTPPTQPSESSEDE